MRPPPWLSLGEFCGNWELNGIDVVSLYIHTYIIYSNLNNEPPLSSVFVCFRPLSLPHLN